MVDQEAEQKVDEKKGAWFDARRSVSSFVYASKEGGKNYRFLYSFHLTNGSKANILCGPHFSRVSFFY